MQIDIINGKKEAVGKVDLNDGIFGCKINTHLLHSVIQSYLANKRQGTQSAKTRAEVAGSGRKPWKQKGTGRARAGSIRSPLWRHGGMIFAVKPRSYRKDLSKNERVQALFISLSDKVKAGRLKVVDGIPEFSGKTKNFVKWLKNIGLDGKKTLLVQESVNKDLMRSAANYKKADIVTVDGINSLSVMLARDVVFTEKSLALFQQKRKS